MQFKSASLIRCKEEAFKQILASRQTFNMDMLSKPLRRDYEVNMLMAETVPSYMMQCDRRFRDTRPIVQAALLNFGGHALRYASERLKSDRRLAYRAVLTYPRILRDMPLTLKRDRFLVKCAVRKSGDVLAHLLPQWKDDFNTVRDAVNHDGYALRFASERLRSDPRIIYLAVAQQVHASRFCAQTNILDLAETSVFVSGYFLKLADLQKDADMVMKTVKTNGWALRWASDECRSDVKIVLAAMRTCSSAFQFATGDAKSDSYLHSLAKRLDCLRNKLPRLCMFLLKRHRDEKDSHVKAAVDLWLIKNGLDHWMDSKRSAA